MKLLCRQKCIHSCYLIWTILSSFFLFLFFPFLFHVFLSCSHHTKRGGSDGVVLEQRGVLIHWNLIHLTTRTRRYGFINLHSDSSKSCQAWRFVKSSLREYDPLTRGYKVECDQAAVIVLFLFVCVPLHLDCADNKKYVIVKHKERPQDLTYITSTLTTSTAMLIAS